jgi:hypothetical protein
VLSVVSPTAALGLGARDVCEEAKRLLAGMVWDTVLEQGVAEALSDKILRATHRALKYPLIHPAHAQLVGLIGAGCQTF